MALTQKLSTNLDYEQTLQGVYNETDKSLTTSTFITAQLSNLITRVDTSAGNLGSATAGDDFSYFDGTSTLLLYTIRVLYSDSNKTILFSVQRVA